MSGPHEAIHGETWAAPFRLSPPWVLDVPLGRALTLNQVYGQANRYQRASLVREWRYAAKLLARSCGLPALEPPVVAIATPHTRGQLNTDAGAEIPAAKAVLDGVVDAGLLPGDGPKIVVARIDRRAVASTWDGVRLELVRVADLGPEGVALLYPEPDWGTP